MLNSYENNPEQQMNMAREVLGETEPQKLLKPALVAVLRSSEFGFQTDQDPKVILQDLNSRRLHLLLVLIASGGSVNNAGDTNGMYNSLLTGVPFQETGLSDYSLKANLTRIDDSARTELHSALSELAQDDNVQAVFTPNANIESLPIKGDGIILEGRARLVGMRGYKLTQITPEANPFQLPYETARVVLETTKPVVVIPPFLSILGVEHHHQVIVQQQRAGTFQQPELRFREMSLILSQRTLYPK